MIKLLFSKEKRVNAFKALTQVYGRSKTQAIVKYKDLQYHGDRKMSLFAGFLPNPRKKASKIRQVILASTLIAMASPATASDATALVTAAAKRHRVPVDLALRVGRAESGLQCHRHNRSGASGPLQIMPSTARAMGYRGPSIGRASCAVQTEWGMRHLAMCYRGAKGDRRIAAACHYQGVSALQRVSRAGAAYARRVVR